MRCRRVRRAFDRAPRRGMTLLEAVFSVLVLMIGVVAVFGMISRISTANRTMAYQNSALDAFAQISAQIRDAKCVFPAATPGDINLAVMDPGLDVIGNGWITQQGGVANSTIERVGLIDTIVPNIVVAYRVEAEAVAVTAAPVLDIDVKIRQVMNDATMDDPSLDSGYWIQIYPVKKMCSPQADATARGEY